MARIRRPKTINGSEYTFGGGSGGGGTVGGLVKIAKGNMNTNNANHDGFLSSGDTVTVKLDAGTSIPTKDQYIFFDNAFETATGTVSYEFMNGDTALPAGITFSQNTDSTNTDTGEARFSGTPTTEGTNSFRVKVNYPSGTTSEQVEIIYTIKRFASGTTPVWSSTELPTQIIRNTAGDQVLAAAPTTTYSGANFRLSNVSGFATGVVPTIDAATGEVVVTGVGDIVQDASAHAFTVTADLGSDVGTFTQEFTGSISYGDPVGSRYWGPGSAYRSYPNGTTNYTTNGNDDYKYGTYYHNFDIGAGAAGRQRSNNDSYDTSPYNYGTFNTHEAGRPLGLRAQGINTNWQAASSPGATNPIGYLSGKASSNFGGGASTNGQYVRFLWVVPNGVETFSAVCVGAGAPGAYNWASDGGGGGGLAWINDVTCTPGETFEVQIGMGRYPQSSNSAEWGGDSFIRRSSNSEMIIYGWGGGYQARQSNICNTGGFAGSWSGTDYNQNNQRDPGAASASTAYGTRGTYFGGRASDRSGGGAAGYEGRGGYANQNAPANGGGGGGGRDYSSTYGQSAGGGVGLDGRGHGGNSGGSGYEGSWNYTSVDNGVAAYAYGGGGGSGGSRGAKGQDPNWSSNWIDNRYITGGMHGGGGGGSGTSWGGGAGGCGGVRIIWGTGRAFPKTNTTEDLGWTHPY